MLGPRMIYSCGYWRSPRGAVFDLETAQEAKLDLVFRKLDLQRGQRVLDIGCGWGGCAALRGGEIRRHRRRRDHFPAAGRFRAGSTARECRSKSACRTIARSMSTSTMFSRSACSSTSAHGITASTSASPGDACRPTACSCCTASAATSLPRIPIRGSTAMSSRTPCCPRRSRSPRRSKDYSRSRTGTTSAPTTT